METDFIEITNENIDHKHLCCIIRSKATLLELRQNVKGSKTDWMKDMSFAS